MPFDLPDSSNLCAFSKFEALILPRFWLRVLLIFCWSGWGQSVIIGVAGAGQEISTRPFQLVTGRKWLGSAFGGVKGRTQLPGMVEDAMKGKIQLEPFVTHTMGLDQINEAFDLMHEGKSIRTVIHYE